MRNGYIKISLLLLFGLLCVAANPNEVREREELQRKQNERRVIEAEEELQRKSREEHLANNNRLQKEQEERELQAAAARQLEREELQRKQDERRREIEAENQRIRNEHLAHNQKIQQEREQQAAHIRQLENERAEQQRLQQENANRVREQQEANRLEESRREMLQRNREAQNRAAQAEEERQRRQLQNSEGYSTIPEGTDYSKVPSSLLVTVNSAPTSSGTYVLNKYSKWNSHFMWVKEDGKAIVFKKDDRWVVALRSPLAVLAQENKASVGPSPPSYGYSTHVVINSIFDRKVSTQPVTEPLTDVSGKWQFTDSQSVQYIIEIFTHHDGSTRLSHSKYANKFLEIQNAQVHPPTEVSGFISAQWFTLVHDNGIPSVLYISMVNKELLHVMSKDQVSVAKRIGAEALKNANDADEIARNILKKLFGTHFTKPVIERVVGCKDSPMEGRVQTTSNCVSGARLSIHGQNFASPASVLLVSRGDNGLSDHICLNVEHDSSKPNQLLECQLPPELEPGMTVDVVVIAPPQAGQEGYESIMYKAATMASASKNTLRELGFKSFTELGVGGLGDEFSEIFRRAFASRLQDEELIAKLGIRHIRGLVLHGPPGTGKTLLARKISEVLGASKVHTVSGPEIMSKYVGQSEQNLRKIFDEAAEEAEEDDGLHLIIFDEMDAIMLPRGSGDDSGARAVYDGVTTQLLALMDGMKDRGNLLVIGLTNRLNAVDAALLRPGRFEVKIKMPLPDEKGRKEILLIQTKKARDSNYISNDVDLDTLARETPSHTGADIEAIVKSATSHALSELLDQDLTEATQGLKISMTHFRRALREVIPSHGSVNAINTHLERGIIHYDEHFTELLLSLDKPVFQVRKGKHNKMLRVLVEGMPGSGLTAISSFVAKRSNFPFVHLISMEDLIAVGEHAKINKIKDVFENAYLVEHSCIILDKLELILEHGAGRSNGNLLYTLQQLLVKKPSGKGKLLVIVTTNNAEALKYLDVSNWDIRLMMPTLDKRAMRSVLSELTVFASSNHVDEAVTLLPISLGIKNLLWVVDQARVLVGVEEDIHVKEKNIQSVTKFPHREGKLQYLVPLPIKTKKEIEEDAVEVSEKYVPKGIDEGWVTQSTDDEDSDSTPRKQKKSSDTPKARYVPVSVFKHVLESAGLLSGDSDGLPTATGSLIL